MLLHLVRSEELDQDNGGEYLSEEFKSVLIKNQIYQEESCPYSPHQNGTAERNRHTLFETELYLLNQICQKPFGHMWLWLLYLSETDVTTSGQKKHHITC